MASRSRSATRQEVPGTRNSTRANSGARQTSRATRSTAEDIEEQDSGAASDSDVSDVDISAIHKKIAELTRMAENLKSKKKVAKASLASESHVKKIHKRKLEAMEAEQRSTSEEAPKRNKKKKLAVEQPQHTQTKPKPAFKGQKRNKDINSTESDEDGNSTESDEDEEDKGSDSDSDDEDKDKEEDDDEDGDREGYEDENKDRDKDKDGDESVDDGVETMAESKSTGKTQVKRCGRQTRTKVTQLPRDIKALVSAAQNCLRLRIALKNAWTSEPSVSSGRLPERDDLIKSSLQDAYELGRAGGRDKSIRTAFQVLKGNKGNKDTKETDKLRKNVYTVVWAAAAQFRNELKRKAKTVTSQMYELDSLSSQQKKNLATWLITTHPTTVVGGLRNIPNFVFGGMTIALDARKHFDAEKSDFKRGEVFLHPAISELIYQHWGLGARADANLHAATEEFSEVPNNLIAVVCNAIESALMEFAKPGAKNFFTNKQYAAKWDGTMAILEYMEAQHNPSYVNMKRIVWKSIISRLEDTDDVGEVGVDTIGFLDAALEEQEKAMVSGGTRRNTTLRGSVHSNNNAQADAADPAEDSDTDANENISEKDVSGEDEINKDEIDETEDRAGAA